MNLVFIVGKFMYVFPFNDIRFMGPAFAVCYTLAMVYAMAEAIYRIYFIFAAPLPQSEKRPFDSMAMLSELHDLDLRVQLQGFNPLGLLNVKIKISPDRHPEWLYTNLEGTIWVEAIQLGPDQPAMVQYSTLFRDNAMIITRFPQGEQISTATYHSRFAAEDVDAAYGYHIQKVKEWRTVHGKPCVVNSVDDVKAYDTIWHRTHRAKDYSRVVWVYIIKAVLALLTALLMAYNGWLIWATGFERSEVFIVTFFAALLLGVGVQLIPTWIQAVRFHKRNAVDNRKSKPKLMNRDS